MSRPGHRIAEALRARGHGDLADRVQQAQSFPWHLGGQADDTAADTYRALTAIKQALDRLVDPADEWRALGRDVTVAVKSAGQTREATTQVREALKKLAAHR